MQKANVRLSLSRGVNVSDYYTDFLVDKLIPFLKEKGKKLGDALELGTGRGYISILLAKTFPVRHIIATDIDTVAVNLAKKNVRLNDVQDRVSVILGNLFIPAKGQKFDLIVSVPPQIPLTKKQVEQLIPQVERYHLTTSVGGKTGRTIVDKIIRLAPEHLNPGGVLSFVHSDLIDFSKTVHRLETAGFRAKLLGIRKRLLQETRLTRLSKSEIEATGYRFQKDKMGREFLQLGVFVGIYDPTPRQKHSSRRPADNNKKS